MVVFGLDEKDNMIFSKNAWKYKDKEYECPCCGKKLVPHKRGDNTYFQHLGSTGFSTCSVCSYILLTEMAITDTKISLPPVEYTTVRGNLVREEDTEDFEIYESKVVGSSKIRLSTNRGIIYLVVSGDYVDGVSKCLIVDINIKEVDKQSDLSAKVNVIKRSLLTGLRWVRHPRLDEVSSKLTDARLLVKLPKGVEKFYCPQDDKIVSLRDCDSCEFLCSRDASVVTCLGGMSKKDLLDLDPSVVFKPKYINYNGRCLICSSDDTDLIDLRDGLYVSCKKCGARRYIECPLCGGVLEKKLNKRKGQEFIGCKTCDFTLTYKDVDGNFADEIKFIGEIDSITREKYEEIRRFRESKRC